MKKLMLVAVLTVASVSACKNPPWPQLPDPNCGDWPPPTSAQIVRQVAVTVLTVVLHI